MDKTGFSYKFEKNLFHNKFDLLKNGKEMFVNQKGKGSKIIPNIFNRDLIKSRNSNTSQNNFNNTSSKITTCLSKKYLLRIKKNSSTSMNNNISCNLLNLSESVNKDLKFNNSYSSNKNFSFKRLPINKFLINSNRKKRHHVIISDNLKKDLNFCKSNLIIPGINNTSTEEATYRCNNIDIQIQKLLEKKLEKKTIKEDSELKLKIKQDVCRFYDMIPNILMKIKESRQFNYFNKKNSLFNRNNLLQMNKINIDSLFEKIKNKKMENKTDGLSQTDFKNNQEVFPIIRYMFLRNFLDNLSRNVNIINQNSKKELVKEVLSIIDKEINSYSNKNINDYITYGYEMNPEILLKNRIEQFCIQNDDTKKFSMFNNQSNSYSNLMNGKEIKTDLKADINQNISNRINLIKSLLRKELKNKNFHYREKMKSNTLQKEFDYILGQSFIKNKLDWNRIDKADISSAKKIWKKIISQKLQVNYPLPYKKKSDICFIPKINRTSSTDNKNEIEEEDYEDEFIKRRDREPEQKKKSPINIDKKVVQEKEIPKVENEKKTVIEKLVKKENLNENLEQYSRNENRRSLYILSHSESTKQFSIFKSKKEENKKIEQKSNTRDDDIDYKYSISPIKGKKLSVKFDGKFFQKLKTDKYLNILKNMTNIKEVDKMEYENLKLEMNITESSILDSDIDEGEGEGDSFYDIQRVDCSKFSNKSPKLGDKKNYILYLNKERKSLAKDDDEHVKMNFLGTKIRFKARRQKRLIYKRYLKLKKLKEIKDPKRLSLIIKNLKNKKSELQKKIEEIKLGFMKFLDEDEQSKEKYESSKELNYFLGIDQNSMVQIENRRDEIVEKFEKEITYKFSKGIIGFKGLNAFWKLKEIINKLDAKNIDKKKYIKMLENYFDELRYKISIEEDVKNKEKRINDFINNLDLYLKFLDIKRKSQKTKDYNVLDSTNPI